MGITFCSIASGSNGNCIFYSNESTRLLVDAGLSGKRVEEGLKRMAVDPAQLDGIFVTHEHSDHITGVGVLSRRYDLPIFATESTWQHMEGFVGKIKSHHRQVIYKNEPFVLNDVCVKPFEIPHDASETVGYSFISQGKKVSVATDIGHVTDCLKENLYDSDVLLIESNYDIDMLQNGPYPYRLKKRIMGDYGHLSNVNCGHLLCEIMSPKLKHIYLGHLSGENNLPQLAFETVKETLQGKKIEIGKMVQLSVALRGTVSEPLIIGS